jgi:hypothetical protein
MTFVNVASESSVCLLNRSSAEFCRQSWILGVRYHNEVADDVFWTCDLDDTTMIAVVYGADFG